MIRLSVSLSGCAHDLICCAGWQCHSRFPDPAAGGASGVCRYAVAGGPRAFGVWLRRQQPADLRAEPDDCGAGQQGRVPGAAHVRIRHRALPDSGALCAIQVRNLRHSGKAALRRFSGHRPRIAR